YDESVFDNPELPESQDHDFEWNPIKVEQHLENDLPNKIEPTTPQSVTKTRKRPTSPSSTTTNSDIGRRSSRQKTSIQ
ncbi:unnamed protein product, partial [Rotaria socialis]